MGWQKNSHPTIKTVKMKNKVYSFILILAMVLTQFVPALADNLNEFEINESGVLVKYNGDSPVVTIPETVTHIGEKAFAKNSKLVKVDFGQNVKTVDKGAFMGCQALHYVNLNEGLNSIGDEAFKDCKKIEYINLPDSLTTLGAKAFYSSGIQFVKIPENVTVIPNHCFYNSQLKGAVLNEKLETIGASAFETCYNLQGLIIPQNVKTVENSAVADNGSHFKWLVIKGKDTVVPKYLTDQMEITYYGDKDSNLKKLYDEIYNKNNKTKLRFKELSDFKPQTIIELHNTAAMIYGGEDEQIEATVVPGDATENRLNYLSQNPEIATVSNTGLVHSLKIGRTKIMIFSAEQMREFELWVTPKDGNPFEITPEGELVGYYGIEEKVVIPEQVKKINKSAFMGNKVVSEITITENVTDILEDAFSDCVNLRTVKLEKSKVSHIGNHAFKKCTLLKAIVLPTTLETLGEGVFMNCEALESVDFGQNRVLTKISKDCFNNCKQLKSIKTPESVTAIEEGAFSNDRELAKVELNKGIVKIGRAAFARCINLTKLDIPEGVKQIGTEALQSADALLELNLPKTFEYVENNLGNPTEFGKLIDFTDGENKGALKAINIPKENNFYYSHQGIVYTKDNKLAYIPCGITHAIIKTGTVEVLSSVARGHMNLVEVTIPKTVTKIGDSAFQNCFGLETVLLPDEIIELGNASFLGCEELKNIAIPKSAKKIGGLCFYELENVKYLVVPDGVEKIESYAVAGNDNMEHLILSRNINYISDNGCSFCPSLKELYLPEKLIHIGKQGFGKLSGVTHLELPKSLRTVSDEGFSYAESLKSIYIPNTVELGQDVFKGLKADQKVALFSHEPNDSIKALANTPNFSLFDLEYNKNVNRKVETQALENILGETPNAKFKLDIREKAPNNNKEIGFDVKLSEDGKVIETLKNPILLVVELKPEEEGKDYTVTVVGKSGEKSVKVDRLNRFLKIELKELGTVVLKEKVSSSSISEYYPPVMNKKEPSKDEQPDSNKDKDKVQANLKIEKITKNLKLKVNIKLLKDNKVKVMGFVVGKNLTKVKKAGYTVKYRFYNSNKPNKEYRLVTETNKNYCITKFKNKFKYFKVRVIVYNKDGKIVAKSKLNQCKLANVLV